MIGQIILIYLISQIYLISPIEGIAPIRLASFPDTWYRVLSTADWELSTNMGIMLAWRIEEESPQRGTSEDLERRAWPFPALDKIR